MSVVVVIVVVVQAVEVGFNGVWVGDETRCTLGWIWLSRWMRIVQTFGIECLAAAVA